MLSRQHADVWEESGKLFIRDVKSANGTFINAERLSAEAVKSDPFELKTDDIVVRLFSTLSPLHTANVCLRNSVLISWARTTRRSFTTRSPPASYGFCPRTRLTLPSAKLTTTPNSSIPSQTVGQVELSAGRSRTNAQCSSRNSRQTSASWAAWVAARASRAAGTASPSTTCLSGELQKSRETSAEIGAVAGAMGEIENVMAGGQRPNLPPYPHALPSGPPSQHAQQ